MLMPYPKLGIKLFLPLMVIAVTFSCKSQQVVGEPQGRKLPPIETKYSGGLRYHLPNDTGTAYLYTTLELRPNGTFECLLYQDEATRNPTNGGFGTFSYTDSSMTFIDPSPYPEGTDLCKVLNGTYGLDRSPRRLYLYTNDCNGWHYEYELVRTEPR